MQCFDNKDDSYLKVVKKFFLTIDEETMNENTEESNKKDPESGS